MTTPLYKNVTQQRRIEEGLCLECGLVPHMPGHRRCRDCADKRITYQRSWYAKNPGYQSHIARPKRYGLTQACIEELLAAQKNKCPICQETLEEYHIDHDHANGAVRGLLCGMCNKGLGHFNDDPKKLTRAANYLRRKKT